MTLAYQLACWQYIKQGRSFIITLTIQAVEMSPIYGHGADIEHRACAY